MPLEEDSSKLTTFLLPSGRFRFLCDPMGLSCSCDEFCRRSDKVVEGLPGVRKLVDDILIQAPDLETLRSRIDLVLEQCKKHNFTLSKRKLEIGEIVEFAGQIVSRGVGHPRHATNLLKAKIKASVDIKSTNSKWTALLTIHVHTVIHPL